jgi:antitoxin component HigA of HigAB toxin-antitoxin module
MIANKIQSDKELNEAIKKLDALLTCGADLSSADHATVDTLAEQIREYEDRMINLPELPAVDLLRSLLSIHELTPIQLASLTGLEQSTIEDFLENRRNLTADEATRIAAYFRLRPGTFPMTNRNETAKNGIRRE